MCTCTNRQTTRLLKLNFFSFWRLNWEKKHARHGMRVFREGWARKIFQIWSETSLCISRWKKECKARTFSISLSGFLGFANVYAMRVNLSVAIVYMAGEKGMAWKESQQGFILGEIWKVLLYTDSSAWGMFFYGYVLTQVPGGRLAEKVGGKWLFGGGVLGRLSEIKGN